jgi:hypothetical protein
MAPKNIAVHVTHHDTLASKTASAVPLVQKIEDGLELTAALSSQERRQLDGVIRNAPDDAIARVIALAIRHGGSIVGIPFDATAAKAALADAEGAFALSAAMKTVARRLEDEGLRAKAGVAEQATAAILGLRGIVRTPQGKVLGQELAEITRVKRAHSSRKRARPAPSPEPPQEGAKVSPSVAPPGPAVPSGHAVLNVPLGQPTVTTAEVAG